MVAALPSGWVIMAERQVLPGYCLHAVLAGTAALRVNYALFGNLEPALHAHVFPRTDAEPEASRTAQPWALDWNDAPEYSEATHGELRRRIGAWLKQAST
jgi:hypothetical protein